MTTTATAPRPLLIKAQDGKLLIDVPWGRSTDRLHEYLLGHGISTTACIDPANQEAHLELWPGVERGAAQAALDMWPG